jgi:hypothetical protein
MAETVRFARSLYHPAAVEASVTAYGSLATFAVKTLAEDIEVTITDPDPEVAGVIADELCNHVLAETIKRARG